MKQKLYALYDVVAEQYGPIFQAVNNATAIRTVQNMRIRAYHDFRLVCLGEWDMEGGHLDALKESLEIEWVTPTYENEMKEERKNLGYAGVPK